MQGIILEGCNFTGNSGNGNEREFGAAVALSLLSIFEQRVTAERHKITNWYAISHVML